MGSEQESMHRAIQQLAEYAMATNQRLDRLDQANEQWRQTNTLLMAEVHVLRAFCSALAQMLPIERRAVLATFSMLCSTMRPDERTNKSAADTFDAVSQMISLALQAPPGPLPPAPPSPLSKS